MSSLNRYLGLAVVLAAGIYTHSAIAAAGFKSGSTLPDLTGFKLEGKLPADLKDKVVLLDFFASWCEPCKASFPVMEQLHKQYGPKGLVIIAVNVDEVKGDMEAFLKKNQVTFTVVRDGGQKLVEQAGVATMPTSFLVGRDGKIVSVHSGFKGEETRKKYAQEIEALLK